jgi:hypothetical protein
MIIYTNSSMHSETLNCRTITKDEKEKKKRCNLTMWITQIYISYHIKQVFVYKPFLSLGGQKVRCLSMEKGDQ